jgi:hypothetical protein
MCQFELVENELLEFPNRLRLAELGSNLVNLRNER